MPRDALTLSDRAALPAWSLTPARLDGQRRWRLDEACRPSLADIAPALSHPAGSLLNIGSPRVNL